MILFRLVLALFSTPLNSEKAATTNKMITYEVCLSPACIADGAPQTLERLRAIAPPNVIIKEGTCKSFCGNGPVVLNPTEPRIIRHRKVKGAKLIDLLAAEGILALEIVEGYDLVLKADDFYAKKNYRQAVELYEKAVDVAFRSAVELQGERDRMQKEESRQTKAPLGLEWLVRARSNEAMAKLEMGDPNAALLAAQAACNLSRNTNIESFRVLAEIYKRKGDVAAELQTLQTMFALPIDESTLPFQMQNNRRELRFRLAKLERDPSARNKT